MSIESARSFARGEVSREEVLALANRFREGGPEDSNGPYKVRTITDMLDSINSYATDILVSNGDLHIAGDLDLDVQLLVDGNLSVDGCYRDSDVQRPCRQIATAMACTVVPEPAERFITISGTPVPKPPPSWT